MMDHEVDCVHVDESVAVNPGHIFIDLGDDDVRIVDGSPANIDADAQAHKAVFVGKRGLNEGDINGYSFAVDQVGNFGKKNGRVIGKAMINRVPGVVPDKKGVVSEVIGVFLSS